MGESKNKHKLSILGFNSILPLLSNKFVKKGEEKNK